MHKMVVGRSRVCALLLLVGFMVSTISSTILSTTVTANAPISIGGNGTDTTPYISNDLKNDVAVYNAVHSLFYCLKNTGGKASERTLAQIQDGAWQRSGGGTETNDWSHTTGARADLHCDTFLSGKSDWPRVRATLGWSSNLQAVCAMGYHRFKANKTTAVTDCQNGDGSTDSQSDIFKVDNLSSDATYNKIVAAARARMKVPALKNIDFKDRPPAITYALAYGVYINDSNNSRGGCKASAGAGITAQTQGAVKLKIVQRDGSIKEAFYKSAYDAHAPALGSNANFKDAGGLSCGAAGDQSAELPNLINASAAGYADTVKSSGPGSDGTAGSCTQYATVHGFDAAGVEYSACMDGLRNKSQGTAYCDKYTGIGSTDSQIASSTGKKGACLYGVKTATEEDQQPPGGTTDENEDQAPACNPNLGIGWLLCPVVTLMASIADTAKGFIDNALIVPTSSLLPLPGQAGNQTAYQSWGKMRDIANVLFVIAFMFMIYSQLTSFGMSNYGIKKMIPKLIVAAILINASYFLCVGAVEISNVTGRALDSLIAGDKCQTDCITVSTPEGVDTSGIASSGKGLAGLAATALAIGVAGYFFLPQVIAVIIYVAFIAMVAAIMLGIRQAIIVLLVVVSPLAFAAYLLPNTEGMFKKWWGLLKGLLYLYPIFALLYGAGKLAAAILGASSDWQLQIFGYIALFTGLLALPKLLEAALAIGGIAAIVNRASGKARGATQGKAKSIYDNSSFAQGKADRKVNRQRRRDTKREMGRAGMDPSWRGRARYRMGRGMRGVIPTKVANRLQTNGSASDHDYAKAAAIASTDEAYEKAVKAQAILQSGMSNSDVAKISTDLNASKEARIAAQDRIMKTGSAKERQAVLEHIAANKQAYSGSEIQRAASGAVQKGDGDIYGKDFANQLAEGGSINSADDLRNAAYQNVAAGKFTAAHAVRSEHSTDYVVESVVKEHNDAQAEYARNATAENRARLDKATAARAALKLTGGQAEKDPSTSKDFSDNMRKSFGKL